MRRGYTITDEMEGLSFAARAVLATATALTYEYQSAEIFRSIVRHALAMSEEAFNSAFEELYEARLLFASSWDTNFDCVTIMSAFEVLSEAMGPGGRPSKREWEQLRALTIERHGSDCFYCGLPDPHIEIDHIIPVSGGGSNHADNLVPACKACNSAKGNKEWSEWRPVMEARRAK